MFLNYRVKLAEKNAQKIHPKNFFQVECKIGSILSLRKNLTVVALIKKHAK